MAKKSAKTCPKCGYPVHDDANSCAACGAHWNEQQQTTEDPYLGKVIEDLFEVESIIGHGSMGLVYKAKHLSYGIYVALKVLRDEFVKNREVRTRFEREAKIASEIEHPNVIRIYHYGKTFLGVPYFAMDCLEGMELAAIVAKQFPLDQRRVCKLCIQIARALEAVHAAGIVHQDLKPANLIVVEEEGEERVKLLDFGIARTPDGEGESRNVEDNAVGTPAFMSPEQVAKQGGITASSDLFSLGGVLYYMLTCRLPFMGEEVVDIATSILTEDPVQPSKVRLDAYVDPQLEQICLKALQKNPANRYASASEMVQAFEAALPLIAEVAPKAKAKVIVGEPVDADLPGETRFLMAAYSDDSDEEMSGGTMINLSAMDVPAGDKTQVGGVSIDERMDDIAGKNNTIKIAIGIVIASLVIGCAGLLVFFAMASQQEVEANTVDDDDDIEVLLEPTKPTDMDSIIMDLVVDRLTESASFGAGVGVRDVLQQMDEDEQEDHEEPVRGHRHHVHRSHRIKNAALANAANVGEGDEEDEEEEEEEEDDSDDNAEPVDLRTVIYDRLKKAQSLEKNGKKSAACEIYRSLVNNDMLSNEDRSFVANKVKSCAPPKKIKL